MYIGYCPFIYIGIKRGTSFDLEGKLGFFVVCLHCCVSLNGMTQTSISRVIQNVKKDISLDCCVSVRQFEYVDVRNLFVQTATFC